MKTVSLITVYNKRDLVKQMTASAQKQKNVTIDYVLLDNTDKKYTCAAQALNYGAGKAAGDVYVFLHQDIEFMADDVLEYIYDFADKNRNVLFGAAGVRDKNKYPAETEFLTGMYMGACSKTNNIQEPVEAFTLDECLIACHKSCMDKLKFDETVCDGWHLYGADLCLQAQIRDDMKVMAVPLDVWHKSGGNADRSYFEVQNRLAKKYRKYFKVINTTNSYVYTGSLKRMFQNIYRSFRYKVR